MNNNAKERENSSAVESKKQSNFSGVWKRLAKNKLAMIGLAIFLFLCVIAVFADVIAPYDYDEMDLSNKYGYPCKEHLMGTDAYGRDMFSRVLIGTRYSLALGMSAAAIATVFGVLFGALAGYFGGWVETVILRFMDVVSSIPGILLNVCLSTALGAGFGNTVLAMSIGGIAGKTRLLRAQILTIRSQEYLEASTAINLSKTRIIFKHVLPNALSPIIVSTAMGIGGTITGAAGLSFLGLGIQEPTPEWGALLSAGRAYLRYNPWLAIFPGAMIAITVFSINMFGDGLRDAMDPKLKN